jgi:hypothetical protein
LRPDDDWPHEETDDPHYADRFSRVPFQFGLRSGSI